MALFDAKEYDPRPARRRWRMLGAAAVLAVIVLIAWYFFRYWPEEHAVNNFLQAVEAKDFEKAYGLFNADHDWKQHESKYKNYTYNQFVLDWGPSGEYGPITSHHIDCSLEPPKKRFTRPSGVIVVVTINRRADPTSLWVQKKDKSINSSPQNAVCHG